MTIIIDKVPEIKQLVQRIRTKLDPHCILCYGSYAVGMQDKKSDIDLLVICDAIPNEKTRNELYCSMPSVRVKELAKDLSHWSPSWTPVNDTIEMNNQKIEVGFNVDPWVNIIIDKLINKHEITFNEFPFRPYSFLGLLETCFCLYERNFYLTKLKAKIRPFPIELKREIVKSQWPILADSCFDMRDALDRNIGILTFQHFVFMALDAIVELLWVINDVYSPASKRSDVFLSKLNNLPPDFMSFIDHSLPRCYDSKPEFVKQVGNIKNYIEEQLVKLKLI